MTLTSASNEGKKMNINVNVLCEECRSCDRFKLKQDDFWSERRIYASFCYCENLDICQKAVEVWEKQKTKDAE